MAYPWTSAYLLDMFNRLTGRAKADSVTPASKYERLTEAQAAIVTDIAGIFPDCLYPTVNYDQIPTLTTSDNQTFTFGTDSNGYPLAPMGKASIYTSLNDIPSNPWRAGRDYIPLGGTAIQIPDNNSWSGTLYWRGITPPGVINETSQPVLFPETARQLIAYRAAIAFLTEGGKNLNLAREYRELYGRPLANTPGMFASQMLEWKTAFRGGGALMNRVTGLAVATGSATNFGVFL